MVPLKKTARGDIQYTQFNDIDSSLLWGTSSTVDDDIPQYNTALRSVVRRRHPIVNISPVAVISLVGLKNLFYRQTLTPVARRPTQSFYHYSKSPPSLPLIPMCHSPNMTHYPLLPTIECLIANTELCII